jgi:V/A-type H+-transporting ATPase subunit I
MIVRMSQFSLLALKRDKDRLLARLQQFEEVHFKVLPLPEEDGFLRRLPEEDVKEMERRRATIRSLISEIEQNERKNRKLVRPTERRRSILRSINVNTMTFSELEQRANEIDIVSLLASIDKVEEETPHGKKTKVLYRIIPWETQKLRDEELIDIRDGRAVLGTVAPEMADAFSDAIRRLGKVYAIVSREKDGSMLFVLKPTAEQREHIEIMAEKYRMKRRSVEGVRMNWEIMNFRRTIDKMISRRNRTDGSLALMAEHKEHLQIHLEYLDNLLLRHEEAKKFLETDSSILLEGWIPTEREDDFREAVQEGSRELGVLEIESAPIESDQVPVKLKNNRFVSTFESLTRMYSMPRYNEIDPTPLFSPFYLMFFGMMLADIGYGLLMMLVTALVLKFLDLKEGIADMLRFLFYLSFSVVAWGAVYGSFFCGLIPMPSLINPNSEYTRVLIMVMVFGFVHLMTALGIKAYIHIREKHLLYAIYDVGFWYMTLIGAALLLVQGYVPALLAIDTRILWVVMIAGMAGIVFTNGRSAKTVGGKGAMGLYSLYGLTNYIGDIISYSRLMAIGLAGGSIGIAINLMIRMLQSAGIIGILVSIPIFIGAHVFNMFISGLSSYVHSARLIYVEFFGKFYEGGGISFVPFRAKSI